MPTREQLTHERVNALIEELGEAGIIDETESRGLTATRDFREAYDVKANTPEPPSVTRAKVSDHTRQEFVNARENDDIQAQLDIIFEILTGDHPDEV